MEAVVIGHCKPVQRSGLHGEDHGTRVAISGLIALWDGEPGGELRAAAGQPDGAVQSAVRPTRSQCSRTTTWSFIDIMPLEVLEKMVQNFPYGYIDAQTLPGLRQRGDQRRGHPDNARRESSALLLPQEGLAAVEPPSRSRALAPAGSPARRQRGYAVRRLRSTAAMLAADPAGLAGQRPRPGRARRPATGRSPPRGRRRPLKRSTVSRALCPRAAIGARPHGVRPPARSSPGHPRCRSAR